MGIHVSEKLDELKERRCKSKFRNYDTTNALFDRVHRTYCLMHTNQTVEYVKSQHEKWLKFDTFEATIMEAADKLLGFVDESDPDADFANTFHAYQTAEGIRAKHPDKDWLILTGFIHDLGKVMGLYNQPQWSTVGDTFPVGCLPSENIVYRQTSFEHNPDLSQPKYASKFGIYKEGIGLDNVTIDRCLDWFSLC